MELREYMSIRRAYNLVRQEKQSADRLAFEEFAILCRLEASPEPVKTSEIAEYQGALRPTMTHRTNRLESLGLIERGEGVSDRRNIVCSISEAGVEYVYKLASDTCSMIPTGQPLARVTAGRLKAYVDAMGAVYCTAGDLLLIALLANEPDPCTISKLVDVMGLLQPTVSMSVSTLVEKGLAMRVRVEGSPRRSQYIELTPAGRERALSITERIVAISVRRRPRSDR